MSVIVARAAAAARAPGVALIPFGMECQEAVALTAAQVASLPDDCQRVVVPVGSGMSLAGILTGLVAAGRPQGVLGVVVGASPERRLMRWAPMGWQARTELVNAGVPYDKRVDATLGTAHLDPVYEAKAVPFLRPGDCLWIVGHRSER